jgi:predicted TIM-barrel fold metal-dependent hydrolase
VSVAVELDLPEANDVVIDCDVFVGLDAGSGVAGGRSLTATDLVSEMDRVGVTTAVVYHVVAREHAPMLGNKLLLAEIRDHPRLIPAFIMLPTHTGEQPPLAELMAQIKEQGVRLARMFPASDLAGHRFAFREWCVGDVLSALESANIPLMLDFSLFRRGEPPWDDIYETYRLHPDLQLVLADVQGRNNRNLYPLLDRFPNIRLCSSGLNVHSGLEDICDRFGAERLLLGSGAPVRSMGAAKFHVDRADLNQKQRTQLLGDNAAALLGLDIEIRS